MPTPVPTAPEERFARAAARAWIWTHRRGLPALRRGARRVERMIERTWAILGRHRGMLARIGLRGVWWAALAAMLMAGTALLGDGSDPELADRAHRWFFAGTAACALVAALAAERRVRAAGVLLGGCHGALGLLAWLALP